MTRFAGSPKISSFLDDGVRWDRMGASSVTNDAKDGINSALNNAEAAKSTMRAITQIEAAESYADTRRGIGAANAGAAAASGWAGVGEQLGGVLGNIPRGGSSFGADYSGLASKDWGAWDNDFSFNVPGSFG